MHYFLISLFLTLFATTELANSVERSSTSQEVQQQRILEQNKSYLERQKKLKQLLQKHLQKRKK